MLTIFASYTALLFAILTLGGVMARFQKAQDEVSLERAAFSVVNLLSFGLFSSSFMAILYIARFRLTQMNELIEKMTQKTCVDRITHQLACISRCVNQICDVLDATKFCYTFNNVGYLLHFFFHSILSIYGLVSYFFKKEKKFNELAHFSLGFAFECYYGLLVVWMFLYAHLIKSDGERMEALILKLATRFCLNKNFQRPAGMLSLQLGHRKPIVEHGLFEVDQKLLFGGMCACFSYLIIIIQFEIQLLN